MSLDPDVRGEGFTKLVFADSGTADTITRTDGDWTADGFVDNDLIWVLGTTANNGMYKIATVAATVLTLDSDASLEDETTGPLVDVIKAVRIYNAGRAWPRSRCSI